MDAVKRFIFILLVFLALACSNSETSYSDSASESESESEIDSDSGSDGIISSSLNRFAVVGNSLYTANDFVLKTFDLTNPELPLEASSVKLQTQAETVFPYQNYLLIGSNQALSLYDIADPNFPSFISTFEHFKACDPVVAANNIAYLTLRAGCGGQKNELQILDISDVLYPALLNRYIIHSPKSLALDGNLLFIAIGNGVRIYNIISQSIIELKEEVLLDDLVSDIVADNSKQTLIVVTNTKILQYDYSQTPVALLSHLNLVP